LTGATSVAPGSAVCRTVAENTTGVLGSGFVNGLPSVTIAPFAAEAPRSERATATPTAATVSLIDKGSTEAP
jgi:hypothetical protein